jgi:PAS domain S-box-containing protein
VSDIYKTKAELIEELTALRSRLDTSQQESEKKAWAEDTLRQSMDRWRLLAQNVPDIIITVTRDGKILATNKPLAGSSSQELFGNSIFDYVDKNHRATMQHAFDSVLSSGESDRYEILSSATTTKSEAWYETRVVPIHRNNAIIGMTLINTDITTRKRTENLIANLHELSITLGGVSDLAVGLKTCLDTALAISDMDCGGIYLFSEKKHTLDLVVHTNLGKEFIDCSSHFDRESNHAQIVLKGVPVYTTHEKLLRTRDRRTEEEMLHALAILPVTHKKNIIGCINVASHSLDEIPSYSRKGLEMVAAEIGSAIARLQAEQTRQQLITELQDALDKIKTLKGFIPICASCKKIRNDEGFWKHVEDYISEHSMAEFTHSVCPECARKMKKTIEGMSAQ